jgi:hypothetical protein
MRLKVLQPVEVVAKVPIVSDNLASTEASF